MEVLNNFNDVETLQEIRTKFRMPHNVKTTGNTGYVIPFFAKEVLPKDDITMTMKTLIKMTTPSFQTMDQAFADIMWFYVTRRQLWEHWKNFQGEKTTTAYEEEPEYSIPYTTAPSGGWGENTIADYLGIPTKIDNLQVDSAYFRAYVQIINEWFRDQNRQALADFRIDDANETGSNGTNYVTDLIKGGMPFRAAKIHDYFTSSLITPTGRESVLLPLGTQANVIGNGMALGLTTGTQNGSIILSSSAPYSATLIDTAFGTNIGASASGGNQISPKGVSIGVTNDATKSGLIADLSTATAATVNQLRRAFQLQKIFERNNIAGHRYMEQLKNRWNVTPDDLTLQRPEYLGGKRIPLVIDMVVQTGSTDSTSPLGQISGFSNTEDEHTYFSKGFKEHGIIMGVIVIRHQRTYQQGLARKFSRRNMEDFYMPEFQNMGEQAILNKEIFAQGNSQDDEVFGYQEYAAEYRFEPNIVTGQFRSNATNSFDNWHYADDYLSLPVNNADWIAENVNAVDRTLTVTSATANQFYMDLYMDETNIRSLPPRSMPGFIDHH